LAAKLTRVLGDAGLRAALGERARARAREHYNWEKITDQYEDLFHRVRHGFA
jgi:glycosyltransferase involved in cell wall biosynthesis